MFSSVNDKLSSFVEAKENGMSKRNFTQIFSCTFKQTNKELTKWEKNMLMSKQLKKRKGIKLGCEEMCLCVKLVISNTVGKIYFSM